MNKKDAYQASFLLPVLFSINIQSEESRERKKNAPKKKLGGQLSA